MPDFGTTFQHPNFHFEPNELASTIIETLGPGIQVQITGAVVNNYWPVQLADGRLGFIHVEHVLFDAVPVPPPPPPPPVARPGRTTGRPNFHSHPDMLQETIIEPGLPTGLGLVVTGEQVNEYWPVTLADGRAGFVHRDHVAFEGVGGGEHHGGVFGGALGLFAVVGSPFDGTAVVTSSSVDAPPHHRPYGGHHSCDMDVNASSRGTPVRLRLTAGDGSPMSGVVFDISPACGSGIVANGGNKVKLRIEREVGGVWQPTGAELVYAHLDPVQVPIGGRVLDGQLLGLLGPAAPAGHSPAVAASFCGVNHPPGDPLLNEYHSSCAVHSHVHIEAKGSSTIAKSSFSDTFFAGRELLRFSL